MFNQAPQPCWPWAAMVSPPPAAGWDSRVPINAHSNLRPYAWGAIPANGPYPGALANLALRPDEHQRTVSRSIASETEAHDQYTACELPHKHDVRVLHQSESLPVNESLDASEDLSRCSTASRNRWSKAEAAVALALQRIFPTARFEKVRPVWLTNERTKRRLEIDVYSESLKLGAERSGLQHFVWPNGIHTSRAAFDALQERDKLKVALCERQRVTLIHVPFTVSVKDTEGFIRDELRRLNFATPPRPRCNMNTERDSRTASGSELAKLSFAS